MRKSALFLTPEAPFPATGGGPLRSASLLHYIAGRYRTEVVVFRQPGAPDPRSSFPPGLVDRILVVDLPYHARSAWARASRNARRAWDGVPPLNDRFAGFEEHIGRLIGGAEYDVGVIEHFWCAPYAEILAPRCGRLILDLHNIESVYFDRCAAIESGPAAFLFRRFHAAALRMERQWLPRFSLALAPSAEDARRVREIGGVRCEVYPNSLPLDSATGARAKAAEEDVIVFSGNLEYVPNVAAVRFFARAIWPSLRRRYPRLLWRLVGRNPRAVARYIGRDVRIEVTGPVEDAMAAMAGAKVAVVPVLSGSGTRVKILEAWAAGVPVVSTTIGAEGLECRSGEHFLRADSAPDFVRAVSSLLDYSGQRDRLATAGRTLCYERFTWQAAWQRLNEIGI